MQATTILPEGYHVKHTLDFTPLNAAIKLNLATIPVAVGFGFLFTFLARILRSLDIKDLFHYWINDFAALLLGIFLISAMLALHELIHGVGFWYFTRSRPKFGKTFFAAYAGAPGWYIPAHQHFIIGIAPVVVLTLLGIVWIWIVPASWLIPIIFVNALQGGGALGDMLVCAVELVQPKSALVEDTGLKITIYRMD